MKILDKLKNALFEEEYVEVEEKPKKVKDKKKKIDRKEIKETYFNNPNEDSKPVAKRIIPQEKKSIETLDDEEVIDNESFRDQDLVDNNTNSKIEMIDEDDLIADSEPIVTEYETTSHVKRRVDNNYNDEIISHEYEEEKETPMLYQNSKKENFYDNYIPHAYGNYEKQREKSKEGFKPSPVISPIYGIVDDNTINNEVRREVRITTPVNRGKMNLEDIRKKAYGSVNINEDVHVSEKLTEEEDNNTVVDLSDDNKTPEINNITMGDAMEYFEDLGLEYNEDYIDKSKMTRTEINKQDELENRELKITDNTGLEENDDLEHDDVIEDNYNILDDRKFTVSDTANDDDIIVTEKQDDQIVDNSDSDNLFDLIDSMYE